MPPDDKYFTFNPPSNEDKELLLSHGYRPGELTPEEAHELLKDLRAQTAGDEDSDRGSNDVPADERDRSD
jgi:hypothetical protein